MPSPDESRAVAPSPSMPNPNLVDALVKAAGEGSIEEVTQLIADGVGLNERSNSNSSALQEATEHGRLDVIKLLLNAGADADVPWVNDGWGTALQFAVASESIPIVKLLLDAKANANGPASARYRRTALQGASEKGSIEIVKLLLLAGADVDARASQVDSATALQLAAGNPGSMNTMKLLLDAGADPNALPAGKYGRRALQAAVHNKSLDMARLLLDLGADVNSCPTEPWGRTPLQAAVYSRSLDMMELLIERGADVNASASKEDGLTALQIAVQEDQVIECAHLLIDSGADFNGLVSPKGALTALQVAVQNGSENTVLAMLHAGVAVDERASEEDGRTALQMAVGGEGSWNIVRGLLAYGADVNAAPAPKDGLTSLQIAVGGGSLPIVQALLDVGADVNACPTHERGQTALHIAVEHGEPFNLAVMLFNSGADKDALVTPKNGLTALQVAVGDGSFNIVKFLLKVNGNGAINDRASRPDNRTLLEIAVCGGSFEMVRMLIDDGADVNAAPSPTGGRTALGFAIQNRSREMVGLLFDKGARPDQRGKKGWTLIHDLCAAGDIQFLQYFLQFGGNWRNQRNHDGSTPLHIAVTERKLDCIDSLIKSGVNLDITDNSGKTPLGIGLGRGYDEVVRVLLSAGARTDTLPVDKWTYIHSHLDSVNIPDLIVLSGGRNQPTTVEIYGTGMSEESWGPMSEKRSFYFLLLSGSQLFGPLYFDFVHPAFHLQGFPDIYPCEASGIPTDWAWAVSEVNVPTRLTAGIPTLHHLPTNSFGVYPSIPILVAYFTFTVPYIDFDLTGSLSGWGRVRNYTTVGISISWTMKQAQDAPASFTGYFMRSMYFRSTQQVRYLAIPENGAAFFTLFIGNIHNMWLELAARSRLYISHNQAAQLTSAGEDQSIIKSLLQDSQEWARLRTFFEQHISKSKQVLDNFKSHEVLYMKLMDSGRLDAPENLQSIITLSKCIARMEKECGDAISRLEQVTKEMISLEFNLVSIFEARQSLEMARRSIEMSIAANSTAMSMKRLSWVTFIFLPLMFASGLFGMNVDIFSNNPSWLWYIAFSVPFMGFVILGWILFKYVPISKWIEHNIGSRLTGKSAATDTGETLSSGAKAPYREVESVTKNRRTSSRREGKMPAT